MKNGRAQRNGSVARLRLPKRRAAKVASDSESLLSASDHEQIVIRQDPETGLRAIVAIHSTTLGPALGGLRLRGYGGSLSAALEDVLRLSAGMTVKAAAAGLELGGGKAVMLDDRDQTSRHQRLQGFAQLLNDLGGRYITAEDIGTSTADMDLLAGYTDWVVGRSEAEGGMGDPSLATAQTVLGSIRAGLEAATGSSQLADRRIGVVGLGKVGFELATTLAACGARLVVYDLHGERARQLARHTGCEIAPSLDALLASRLDALAPCATGQMIDYQVARTLDVAVLAGSANNLLCGAHLARTLATRGILYVPDFLANCGGLIQVDIERRCGSTHDVSLAIDDALERVREILWQARHEDRTTLEVAEERASRRLAARRARA